ncbi:MAG: hypothetical protein GF364_05135 [Candidatus Lokiarchaeota archaeon]|nr:hypothetical protein [Candidatus Lokiarchaeota archaeon]
MNEHKNPKIICSQCHDVISETKDGDCPKCGGKPNVIYDFRNSDEYLIREVPKVLEQRKINKLNGLVHGLDSLVINTEIDLHQSAVTELCETTGSIWYLDSINQDFHLSMLQTNEKNPKLDYSPKILIQSRLRPQNPFYGFNLNKKTRDLPNTRIETFNFRCSNLDKYFEIQNERGITFMTENIQEYDNFSYIQTAPSHYIGCSYGFIQWHGKEGDYSLNNANTHRPDYKKPNKNYLDNIKYVDHTATRIRARDRDAGILEFLELTNYTFDFAIYALDLNSITSVARYSPDDFAMVFTSGITPFIGSESTGPTERYTFNYGTRVHHIAFHTEEITETYSKLKEDGMEFLIELLGGENDGLHQTFTKQSPNTMTVNEYIHRYGDFKGFFTRSNVRDLTKSTYKQ